MSPIRFLRYFLSAWFCFLLFSCDFNGIWGRPNSDCNPTTEPIILDSKLWSSTFGGTGAHGCLRISWGRGEHDFRGVYVRLDRLGQLQAYNAEISQFEDSIKVTLPRSVRDKERLFDLFLFGSAVERSERQSTCKNKIDAKYLCKPSENGECWLSMRFQLTTLTGGLLAVDVKNGCQLNLPEKNIQKETSPGEPTLLSEQKEPIDSSQDAGTQEPAKETKPLEPKSSEPAKESTPEKRPPEHPSDQLSPFSLWAQHLGGRGDEIGYSLAIDSAGNIYFTGHFEGQADFGGSTIISKGGADIFVMKMNPTGRLLWAKRAGSSGDDLGFDLSVDKAGNIYLTGVFFGRADFGPTTLVSKGIFDIFVAKLDTGGQWLWAKRAGSSSVDFSFGSAVDPSGNVFITGKFSKQADFGTTTLSFHGSSDAFVAKLDTKGNWLWAVQAGSKSPALGNEVASDQAGNAYVTGYFGAQTNFGSTTLTAKGGYEIFVAKLDTGGNWLWAKRAGSTGFDIGCSLAIDSEDNILLSGYFEKEADFGSTALVSKGNNDIFVAKLDDTGSWLWAKRAGSSEGDISYDITVDKKKNAYITGYFQAQADFGTTSLISKGKRDIFVAKLDGSGAWLWAKQAGSALIDEGYNIAVDSLGNVLLVGFFEGQVDFEGKKFVAKGGRDAFLWKTK